MTGFISIVTYQAKCTKVHQARRAEIEKTKLVSFAEREKEVEGEGGTEGAEQLQKIGQKLIFSMGYVTSTVDLLFSR